MLLIQPASDGFLIVDTDEDEPALRCDTYAEAAELLGELAAAEAEAVLQAWPSRTH